MYDFAQKWNGKAALWWLLLCIVLLVLSFLLQLPGSARWQWRFGAGAFFCMTTICLLGVWQRISEGASTKVNWLLAAFMSGLGLLFLHLARKSTAVDIKELARSDSPCKRHARRLNFIGFGSFV